MENSNERNFKQELKELWEENKGKVKVGLYCLAIGFAYGFVKGMDAESKLTSNAMTRLIDKIPPLPEPDDIPFEEFIAEMAKDEGIQISSF